MTDKPSEIPEPTREDLLNLAHSDERQLLESGDTPARNKDQVWEGLRRQWYEGHQREAEQRLEKQSQEDASASTELLPIPAEVKVHVAKTLGEEPMRGYQAQQKARESLRREAASKTEKQSEPNTDNPDSVRSPTMARFFALVDSYRTAISAVSVYCWEWDHFVYIAGGFLVGGGTALALSAYVIAEVLFAIGIALFVLKGMYDLWAHKNRKEIALILCIAGLLAIIGEIFLIERYRPIGITAQSPFVNSEPILTAKVVYFSISYEADKLDRDAVVGLWVHVKNDGAPSIADNYLLTVTLPDRGAVQFRTSLLDERIKDIRYLFGEIGSDGVEVGAKDLLVAKTATTPILQAVEGLLLFEIKGATQDEVEAARHSMQLSFQDKNGRLIFARVMEGKERSKSGEIPILPSVPFRYYRNRKPKVTKDS